MIKNRKIVVGLATIGVIFVAYFIYNLLSGTPRINPDQTNERGENIEIPTFDNEAAKIGDVTAGPVTQSQFIDLDEKTKAVKRIFGYNKLLNPEQGSKKWQLEKPYMDIYDQAPGGADPILSCNIVSDRGTVQMETVAGKPSPTDAHLIGNVVIKVYPTNTTDPTEGTIYLDDLVYNSQRSEFTTTGPVRIVSNRGRMEGRGLVLIYNTGLGRLEYLKVVDLDFIHYKRISQSSSQAANSPDEKSPAVVVTDVPVADVSPPADAGGADVKPKPTAIANVDEATKPQTQPTSVAVADRAAASEKKNYYQCRFIENARIEYGTKIVIDSADEIVINNILWAETAVKKEQPTVPAVSSAKQPVPVKPDTSKPKTSDVASLKPRPTAKAENTEADTSKPGASNVVSLKPLTPVAQEDAVDVFIRCSGGMIILPIDDKAGSVDSSQQVIEVAGRPVRVRQSDQPDDLAQCAMMSYNVDADILRMFTSDKEKYNRLRIAQSDSTLRTTGTITWRRRADHARINGPGVLLFGTETKDDVAEMTFGSVMNLFFVKSPERQTEKLILKSANLAGGMTATLSRGSDSLASADSATFLFDRQSDITVADLKGNVQFASASGKLNSGRAKILFAKNTAGKVYAKTLQSNENPVLQTASASKDGDGDAKPASLQATRIDYDISTGNAVAAGPVKFTFYMRPDKPEAKPVPVVITAEDSARYFATANRVVFSGNVVGSSQTQKDGYGQTNRFYGGKLIVDLITTEDGSEQMDIRHLAVTDGNVRLESRRIANGIKISHVGLMCQQIDYDAAENLLIATGPGEIQMNNANMPATRASGKKKRTKKDSYYDGPSYALVRNFDTLKWYTDKDRIIADGKTKSVYMSYIPVLANGKLGKKDEASVTHMVADFVENQSKQKELLKLTATRGIYYKQGKRGNWFLGENLFYDAKTSLMNIYGSDRWPCMINGAVAENVEYNLLTGRKKTNISSTPGAVGF